MNPRVNEYIEKRKSEAAEAKQKERANFLGSIGLCDGEDFLSAVPIDVTDEEYALLVKTYNETAPALRKKASNVAKTAKITAVLIYIFGFILGISAFDNPLALFGFWLGAFAGGTLLFALAKIIELLEQINSSGRIGHSGGNDCI